MNDPYNSVGKLVCRYMDERYYTTSLYQLNLWMACEGYSPPPYEPIMIDRSNWGTKSKDCLSSKR